MIKEKGVLQDMLHKRIDERIPFQKECILVNQFGLIETQTVDRSKIGLGVKTNSTLPLEFKNGCELAVFIQGEDLPPAELMWTKKDNNMTRLGLKFSTSILD